MPLFLEITGTNKNVDKKHTNEVHETPSTRPSCIKAVETPQIVRHTIPNPQSDESDFATSSKFSSVTDRESGARGNLP